VVAKWLAVIFVKAKLQSGPFAVPIGTAQVALGDLFRYLARVHLRRHRMANDKPLFLAVSMVPMVEESDPRIRRALWVLNTRGTHGQGGSMTRALA
jgi:hypothetical protein